LAQEDFLLLLPDLRLAFSVFTPTQIDRIARLVARYLGVETAALYQPAQREEIYALGLELDRYYRSQSPGHCRSKG